MLLHHLLFPTQVSVNSVFDLSTASCDILLFACVKNITVKDLNYCCYLLIVLFKAATFIYSMLAFCLCVLSA